MSRRYTDRQKMGYRQTETDKQSRALVCLLCSGRSPMNAQVLTVQLGRSLGTMSVSYTHLDVYKRQMLTHTTFDNHKNISYQLVELYHESKAFSVQYSICK